MNDSRAVHRGCVYGPLGSILKHRCLRPRLGILAHRRARGPRHRACGAPQVVREDRVQSSWLGLRRRDVPGKPHGFSIQSGREPAEEEEEEAARDSQDT